MCVISTPKVSMILIKSHVLISFYTYFLLWSAQTVVHTSMWYFFTSTKLTPVEHSCFKKMSVASVLLDDKKSYIYFHLYGSARSYSQSCESLYMYTVIKINALTFICPSENIYTTYSRLPALDRVQVIHLDTLSQV